MDEQLLNKIEQTGKKVNDILQAEGLELVASVIPDNWLSKLLSGVLKVKVGITLGIKQN